MELSKMQRQYVTDLRDQEKVCIEKYRRYKEEARDPELKNLFETLEAKEQEHCNSLDQVLNGCVPECDCNDSDGANYNPASSYECCCDSEDKKADEYLVTDCIGTEKYVSHEYNNNVFSFEDSKLRKLLADIQVEEQNHAEMLYKYKMANGMA